MPKGIFKNPTERASRIAEKARRGQYFNCIVCGKQFWRKPCEILQGNCKFCSRSCYQKWQKGKPKIVFHPSSKKGERNPNWQGGIDPLNKRIRASDEYSEWREAIFRRDNWTCQKCGARSISGCYVRIEAHHIMPFSKFPILRFEVENGVTLCKKCHSKEPKGREILFIK